MKTFDAPMVTTMPKLSFQCRLMWTIAIGFVWCRGAVAQTEPEAMKWARDGIAAIESRNFEQGIDLLTKARNAMPGNYEVAVELGRAHLHTGNAIKAEKVLFPLQYHAEVEVAFYPLLGDSYLMLKKPRQATETYRYGLEKFPESGELYAGLGRSYLATVSLERASASFETGIAKDPTFADNYLYAAKLVEDKHPLWAWLYAETYLNLTENVASRRNAALLVSRNLREVMRGKAKATDPLSTTLVALAKPCMQPETDLASFVRSYTCMVDATKPEWGPLFTLWAELKANNRVEPYVYHLLGEMDKEAFSKWVTTDPMQYTEFIDWAQWRGLKSRINKPFNRIEH